MHNERFLRYCKPSVNTLNAKHSCLGTFVSTPVSSPPFSRDGQEGVSPGDTPHLLPLPALFGFSIVF